jgi:hypothetical protein
MGISVYRGPIGEAHLLRTSTDSKRGLWKWSVSLYGRSVMGTWREGSFTGDSEGYITEGSGDRHHSP